MGALCITGGMSEAETGQRDHLVANCADPLLGLPVPAPFDARECVEGVVPGQANKVVVARWFGGHGLNDLTEDAAPGRSEWAELIRGGEPESARPPTAARCSPTFSARLPDSSLPRTAHDRQRPLRLDTPVQASPIQWRRQAGEIPEPSRPAATEAVPSATARQLPSHHDDAQDRPCEC